MAEVAIDKRQMRMPRSQSWQRHPSACHRPSNSTNRDVFTLPHKIQIPTGKRDGTVDLGGCRVELTNLDKPFWIDLKITKRDLLQYYADISPALLPHLVDRAMVMKRYPNGAAGDFFFMKRAPTPRPDLFDICSIEHASGNVIDFPVVQDLASLLWVVNLGCIDLNPWYGRCDDINHPDFVHFDLDPVSGATFDQVVETALMVRDALMQVGMTPYAKTSGSHGIHVYVPIKRGPEQKQVWAFAKQFAQTLERQRADLVTAQYKIAKRPHGHVLVDYNQNAWGRTLASVYSVRPTAYATVSTPLQWHEVEQGITVEQFTMTTVLDRVARIGDLWAQMASPNGRFSF